MPKAVSNERMRAARSGSSPPRRCRCRRLSASARPSSSSCRPAVRRAALQVRRSARRRGRRACPGGRPGRKSVAQTWRAGVGQVRGEDDERRQVLVHGAQAVADPRARCSAGRRRTSRCGWRASPGSARCRRTFIERIRQMSSIRSRRCGNRSLTSVPHLPPGWNSHAGLQRAAAARCDSPPPTPSVLPSAANSFGLGSNVSMCDTPPVVNRKMTRLALRREVRRLRGASGSAAERRRSSASSSRQDARQQQRAADEGADGVAAGAAVLRMVMLDSLTVAIAGPQTISPEGARLGSPGRRPGTAGPDSHKAQGPSRRNPTCASTRCRASPGQSRPVGLRSDWHSQLRPGHRVMPRAAGLSQRLSTVQTRWPTRPDSPPTLPGVLIRRQPWPGHWHPCRLALRPRRSAAGRRAAGRPGRSGRRRRPLRPAARAAKLPACAWTNGSFIRNSACSGVVLVIRGRRAGVGVGAVEERQERVPLDALRHQVDAAAVRLVDGLERVVLREVPGRLGRERVRAAGRAVEAAADGQQRVADRLGVEPPAAGTARGSRWPGRARAFGRVVGARRSWYVRDSMISRCIALTDQPDFDEPRGQVVEQLGVRRRLALACRSRSASARARGRSGTARCG